jgi:hypothetical protein
MSPAKMLKSNVRIGRFGSGEKICLMIRNKTEPWPRKVAMNARKYQIARDLLGEGM